MKTIKRLLNKKTRQALIYYLKCAWYEWKYEPELNVIAELIDKENIGRAKKFLKKLENIEHLSGAITRYRTMISFLES